MGFDQFWVDEILFDSGCFICGDYVFINVVFYIDEDDSELIKVGEDDFNVDFDGGELFVEEMCFSVLCLVSDGWVMFDVFFMSGLFVQGDDGEGFLFDFFEIVGFDVDFVVMIVEVFVNFGESEDEDFELGEDLFDCIVMSGFQVVDSEDGLIMVSLGFMIFEYDDVEVLVWFEMIDFLIEMDEGDDGLVCIVLGEVWIEGLSIEIIDEWFVVIENDNMFSFMQFYMNVVMVNLVFLFLEFVLSDFDFQVAGIDFSLVFVIVENEMCCGEVYFSVVMDCLYFFVDFDYENGV